MPSKISFASVVLPYISGFIAPAPSPVLRDGLWRGTRDVASGSVSFNKDSILHFKSPYFHTTAK